MNTKFWGRCGWIFLHSIAQNYPDVIDEYNEKHKKKRFYYKQLFSNLKYTLPCKYCRISFKQFMKEDPIDKNLHSKKALTHWLYRIHN